MLSVETIRRIIGEVMRPAHFFIGQPGSLEWEQSASEEIPWEIFQGRLLDRTHTALRRTFETWKIYWQDSEGRSAEPLLAVHFDPMTLQIHVTRAIYCYAWEGYHAGDNVYLSRETRKWVRELAGTLTLAEFSDPEELRCELASRLFLAVVGASRLPLTSVEAPLPAFSLGQLAYFYRPDAAVADPPLTSPAELVQRALDARLTWLEKTKLLETFLRSQDQHSPRENAALFVDRWRVIGHTKQELLALLRNLFDETALSPYTNFVDDALSFVHLLVAGKFLSADDWADFLGYLLRHLGRHLTAYDLITFHHQGANYPDALFLDAVLKDYLRLIEKQPALFSGDDKSAHLRRRGLRQAWLLRHFYEGLPVPDAPTSPGENARILPPPYVRVPDEQILMPHRRTKQLYANDPIAQYLGEQGRKVLQQSIQDLAQPQELRELGMAVFLDRPLGIFKAPGEPDQTVLLSYEAFSRTIAEKRLRFLAARLHLIEDLGEYQKRLADMPVNGLKINQESARSMSDRPGTVSLSDALKVADDFVFLRTSRKSAAEFLHQFDWHPLADKFELSFLTRGSLLLIIGGQAVGESGQGLLVIYDASLRRRLLLQIDSQGGYSSRGGTDYPLSGLRLVKVWNQAGESHSGTGTVAIKSWCSLQTGVRF